MRVLTGRVTRFSKPLRVQMRPSVINKNVYGHDFNNFGLNKSQDYADIETLKKTRTLGYVSSNSSLS